MTFVFQNQHPFVDVWASLFEPAEEPAFGSRCEGGPCGPRGPARGRFGRPGGPRHCRPEHHRPEHHHPEHRHPEHHENSDTFVPAADIYSTETEYKVYISLPGAEKESIELTYDPNTRELAVSGTLVRPTQFASLDEETLKTVLVQGERKVGKFERKIKIPREETGEKIKFDEAAARFEEGVLELTLPKVEKEGAKRIVIE